MGVIEEKALIKLVTMKSCSDMKSLLIEDAHSVVKSDSGEVFVLQGSLFRSYEAIKND